MTDGPGKIYLDGWEFITIDDLEHRGTRLSTTASVTQVRGPRWTRRTD